MSDYTYFTLDEFDCQETGENEMSWVFLQSLDLLRGRCGFPFIITSGYRSPNHSIERVKHSPGVHSEGIAADIRVRNGFERRDIVKHALDMDFYGIGVAKDFVHVDFRQLSNLPRVMWTYGASV